MIYQKRFLPLSPHTLLTLFYNMVSIVVRQEGEIVESSAVVRELELAIKHNSFSLLLNLGKQYNEGSFS